MHPRVQQAGSGVTERGHLLTLNVPGTGRHTRRAPAPNDQGSVVELVTERSEDVDHITELSFRAGGTRPFQLGEHGLLGRCHRHVCVGDLRGLTAVELRSAERPVLADHKVDFRAGAGVDDVEQVPGPVTSSLRGRSTATFWRLCSLAPRAHESIGRIHRSSQACCGTTHNLHRCGVEVPNRRVASPEATREPRVLRCRRVHTMSL